jgi:hypothetical protein
MPKKARNPEEDADDDQSDGRDVVSKNTSLDKVI